jgi:hypothetical protein
MLVVMSPQRHSVFVCNLLCGKLVSQKPLHSRHSSLGVFTKFSKVTVNFIMSVSVSVRPSVSMEQRSSCWTDFHENWYLNIFAKSVKKIQVPLKSDRNKVYCT